MDGLTTKSLANRGHEYNHKFFLQLSQSIYCGKSYIETIYIPVSYLRGCKKRMIDIYIFIHQATSKQSLSRNHFKVPIHMLTNIQSR